METGTRKTNLEISGDKEYRDSLKKVNAQLAEQKSKVKLLTEAYKENQNSQEALTKKTEQLKAALEAQEKVLDVVKQGVKNARQEQQKYGNQMEEAGEKIKAAQEELKTLNETTEDSTKRQTELNSEIKKYKTQLEEASRGQETACAVMEEWTLRQSKAQTAVCRTTSQIKEYERYLKEAAESTDKCAASIDQYGRKVKGTAKEQEKLHKEVDSSEAALDGFVGALAVNISPGKFKEIAEALTECIEAAAGFETALAKVSAIADTSAVDMDTLGKDILALSNETGRSVAELSEAAYGAISAGVETADAVDFVSRATKLAVGGFTDNATSVDFLTTVLNTYGLELARTSEISDYLITTQSLGKTTVGELASSMGEVIPVAAAYHVEMDNLSSAMAILTANGTATEKSSAYLKAMLQDLGDGGSRVSQVLQEQTGVSFSRLMQQGHHLGNVLAILATAVDNDKSAFHELWSSSEAGTGALALLSAGTREYEGVLYQMRESAGATRKAYAQMADTTEMSQEKLENAFHNLKIAVGSQLQDQMKGVYDCGTNLLEWVTAFVQENKWLIPVLEGVALGIGAISVATAGFAVVTKVIIPLWDQFTMALSANPIGLVAKTLVTLTSVLGAVISYISNTTDQVEEQTTAWRDHVDALNSSVEAYQEQNQEAEQAAMDAKTLAGALAELASKERRTTAEKEAMAEVVDRLNEKIPGLGPKYDTLSDSVSMTADELNDMIDAMERQEKYEVARDKYADMYAERKESLEELERLQKELAAASEKQERTKDEYYTSTGTLEDFVAAEQEVLSLTEAIEGLQAAISESDGVFGEMANTMNLHAIETASMTEAERESIDAMLGAAEAKRDCLPEYYAEIEMIAQTAQEYDAYAASVRDNMDSVMQQIQKLEENYQESYQAAYEMIGGQIGLFEQMKVGTSISIDDMIKNMGSQEEYLNNYAKNIRLAMELEMDEGILSQLADGSEESAAILQEIVENGSDRITELNGEFAKVSEGKDAFAAAVAELETYYGEEMKTLVEETAAAVKDMARYDDAYHSAVETCNGIIAGLDEQWDNVMDKYRKLAREAWRTYNREQGTFSPSRKFIWSAEMTLEGIEKGVDQGQEGVMRKYAQLAMEGLAAYRMGMQETEGRSAYTGIAERAAAAMLESCLQAASKNTGAQEAKGIPSQNFYIYTPVKSPSEMMRAARLEQQYGMAGE